MVRNAFRLAVDGEGKRVSSEKNARAAQLLHLKRRQEQQHEEMRAVEVLQRRIRVRLAKRSVAKEKAKNSLARSRVGDLMQQSESVRLMERMLARRAASVGVMWSVYSQVCLEYEQTYLEERERDSALRAYFAAIYEQLSATEEQQHQQAAAIKEVARSLDPVPAGGPPGGGGSASVDSKPQLTRKQTSTAMEVAKALAATPEAVDVLALVQEQELIVREARVLVVKLQRELATWQEQRAEHASTACDSMTLTERRNALVTLGQERNDRVLATGAKLREAEAQRPPHEWQLTVHSGKRLATLAPQQLLVLIESAVAQLVEVGDWGGPLSQFHGQAQLWEVCQKEAAVAALKVEEHHEQLDKLRIELAERQGAFAPLETMKKLREQLDATFSLVKFLGQELATAGVSVLRNRASILYKEGGYPALPTGPDVKEWAAWLEAVTQELRRREITLDVSGGRLSNPRAGMPAPAPSPRLPSSCV